MSKIKDNLLQIQTSFRVLITSCSQIYTCTFTANQNNVNIYHSYRPELTTLRYLFFQLLSILSPANKLWLSWSSTLPHVTNKQTNGPATTLPISYIGVFAQWTSELLIFLLSETQSILTYIPIRKVKSLGNCKDDYPPFYSPLKWENPGYLSIW